MSHDWPGKPEDKTTVTVYLHDLRLLYQCAESYDSRIPQVPQQWVQRIDEAILEAGGHVATS